MSSAGYPVAGLGDPAHHRIAAYYAVPRDVATINAANTSDAIALGLDAALPAVFELRGQIGEFGRGERTCGDTIQLSLRIVGGASGAGRGDRTA